MLRSKGQRIAAIRHRADATLASRVAMNPSEYVTQTYQLSGGVYTAGIRTQRPSNRHRGIA